MSSRKSHHKDRRRIEEKVRRHLYQYFKKSLFLLGRNARDTRPVFVLGYGRSGTSMLLNSFERDLRIEILGENDPKIAKNYLLVYEKIPPAIDASKADVLVMKPILNSFDATEILERYEVAKIIWMIRDYMDVIASTHKRFGTVVPGYMKQLVLYGDGDNWLTQGLPLETLEQLRSLKTDTYRDYDWIALVWWAVNRIVITNNLCQHERFMLLRYEQLVQNVDEIMRQVYKHIDLPYKLHAGSYIDKVSLGKGAEIKLDATVDQMCVNLGRKVHKMC